MSKDELKELKAVEVWIDVNDLADRCGIRIEQADTQKGFTLFKQDKELGSFESFTDGLYFLKGWEAAKKSS